VGGNAVWTHDFVKQDFGPDFGGFSSGFVSAVSAPEPVIKDHVVHASHHGMRPEVIQQRRDPI
jgi:hypothetical protein